jgi:hypothetical protein
MDVEILKKLIGMKQERMSSLSAEAHALNAQCRDLLTRLEEVKHRLATVESARNDIIAENSMLLQAIGDQTPQTYAHSDDDLSESGEFIVNIQGDGAQGVTPIDLRLIDFSDGEPKVRKHTLDVRRYAVLVTLQSGPRSTAELIAEFDRHGFQVAEENAVANLSAILSRTSFFKSENRRWHLDSAKLLSAPRLHK